MKGHVGAMARDEWGHLPLLTALSVVDDTSLLRKALLPDLQVLPWPALGCWVLGEGPVRHLARTMLSWCMPPKCDDGVSLPSSVLPVHGWSIQLSRLPPHCSMLCLCLWGPWLGALSFSSPPPLSPPSPPPSAPCLAQGRLRLSTGGLSKP